MFAVRYAALTALVLWLGGMVILGALVAPSTFQVLQAVDQADGRILGGLVFGDVLRRFHLLAYGCGAVLFVALFVMKFVGPPPAAFIPRSLITATMLLIAGYSGFLVSGEISTIQRRVAMPVSHLATDHPDRLRFDQLHRTSTTLMLVNMGLGFVLLAWYARE